MRILAVESPYLPYFEKLICETDVLERMQPLMQQRDAMKVMELTPAGQRSREAHHDELWRAILAGLPAVQRPPFSAAHFAGHVRNGQLRLEWLAQEIVSHGTRHCPERLQPLGATVAAREARLQEVLRMMFERMVRQDEAMRAQELLARYDRLPGLLTLARASGRDVHEEQARLAREHDAQKKPYRLSMPYRNPGRPCQSGEHHVAMVKHTLVNPARNEKAELWEAELHEAREHGAALPGAVAALLGNLTDAD